MLYKNLLPMYISVICGGILNDSSGEIRAMDRNNDGLYDNNLECQWSIVCGPNQLVELTILSIDFEMNIFCSFDYIEVRYPPAVNYDLVSLFLFTYIGGNIISLCCF